ncbi:class I SAM-dependent methyltransferase [Patescibacteria group bacterium]|nr:class I SAM-dependent methyltransferase [Patescibacteria group bacterium]
MDKSLIHEMAHIEDNYWWFKQKRHFISLLIKKYSKENKEKIILDCGCGTGKTMKMLEQYGKVFGTDFDTDCIQYCNDRGIKNVFKSDLNIKLETNQKFDLIVITDVLEHIEKDKFAFNALVDHLNTNGLIVISVPAHSWMFSYWDKLLHHKRRYSKKMLSDLLKQNKNIEIKQIGYFNLLSFFPALISRYIISKIIPSKTEFKSVNPILNNILFKMGKIDNFLAKTSPLYFGLSLFAVVKKTDV